jgi:phenylalanine-4-hydroxylase
MKAPLEHIPGHLQEYITEQDPSLYTPIDHAVWRYVMRVSKHFFGKHGHPLYLQGLETTGISTDRIPLVTEMDTALRKLGWRAVVINGFIPPAIFLEFQSLRILAIACDIRKLENLGYTPSPDIIHEAAGHVPIVADPDYRAYLEDYGEVARNAIITKFDLELYDSIFKLSEIKENPQAKAEDIARAQAEFEAVAKRETLPSEAALLTRMAWWTTEYGLLEVDNKPLIYGAGLLSSIQESYHCLDANVKKIPFKLDTAIHTSYDITRPQPQLFVAKSFADLRSALDDFADTMAYRRGGAYGLEIGRKAENTVSVMLDNGITLSGIVKNYMLGDDAQPCAFTLSGLKQVSFDRKELDELHTHSLSEELFIPLFSEGALKSSPDDLKRKLHGSGLTTRSGMRIQGRFKKELTLGRSSRIWLLENVKIVDTEGRVAFSETRKHYPLFLASSIPSVYGGAADRNSFLLRNRKPVSKVKSHKTNLTPTNSGLCDLYAQVRRFRDSNQRDPHLLDAVLENLRAEAPQDWLLRLELLELYSRLAPEGVAVARLRQELTELKRLSPETNEMIERGIACL